jgi:dolichyl-phosphate-mannose--protein O-mannosyl transferase
VPHGAVLTLRHVITARTLHSHPFPYGHPGTSGQQQVTGFAGADDNDLWRIKPAHGRPTDAAPVPALVHGEVVRLEHLATRRNLHSHAGFPSPVTKQQEVTAYGQEGTGDANDDWRLELEGGGTWQVGRWLRLIHVATGCALHSHGGYSHPEWTKGQQEVTAIPGRDDNDLWYVAAIRSGS